MSLLYVAGGITWPRRVLGRPLPSNARKAPEHRALLPSPVAPPYDVFPCGARRRHLAHIRCTVQSQCGKDAQQRCTLYSASHERSSGARPDAACERFN